MKTKISDIKDPFLKRMQKILSDKKDYSCYLESLKTPSLKSIRCNTLKISPEKLKKRLKKWKIEQPWKNNPEIMIIKSEISPGELGRSLEHQLGYYYVQELSSCLPIISLNPEPNETFLDLCASPGSKTTQASAKMENTGTIIANEMSFSRMPVLAANLQRCGCTNVMITKKEGSALANKFIKQGYKFDKILVDAPCSGEGTLRSKPKTPKMWNPNTITYLCSVQKQLLTNTFHLLNKGGEMIYSTCTHAPEENEEVADWFLNKFEGKIKVEKISLPKELKLHRGMTSWQKKKFSKEMEKAVRVYPQDNDTDGFFLIKFKKVKE